LKVKICESIIFHVLRLYPHPLPHSIPN
jgi:hypothetical protein